MVVPQKPDIIPTLDFCDLPEYETSEEGEPIKKDASWIEMTPQKPNIDDPDAYKASLDYINKYYKTVGPESSIKGNLPLDYSNDDKMLSNPSNMYGDDIQKAMQKDLGALRESDDLSRDLESLANDMILPH